MKIHIKAAWLAYYWELRNRILYLIGYRTEPTYWNDFPYTKKYSNFFYHLMVGGKSRTWIPEWIPRNPIDR